MSIIGWHGRRKRNGEFKTGNQHNDVWDFCAVPVPDPVLVTVSAGPDECFCEFCRKVDCLLRPERDYELWLCEPGFRGAENSAEGSGKRWN